MGWGEYVVSLSMVNCCAVTVPVFLIKAKVQAHCPAVTAEKGVGQRQTGGSVVLMPYQGSKPRVVRVPPAKAEVVRKSRIATSPYGLIGAVKVCIRRIVGRGKSALIGTPSTLGGIAAGLIVVT